MQNHKQRNFTNSHIPYLEIITGCGRQSRNPSIRAPTMSHGRDRYHFYRKDTGMDVSPPQKKEVAWTFSGLWHHRLHLIVLASLWQLSIYKLSFLVLIVFGFYCIDARRRRCCCAIGPSCIGSAANNKAFLHHDLPPLNDSRGGKEQIVVNFLPSILGKATFELCLLSGSVLPCVVDGN